jgi:hypothetical protein
MVIIDCEHVGLITTTSPNPIRGGGCDCNPDAKHHPGKTIPVFRVPSHDPSFISTALDAGATGIILPHTKTREHAQLLVNECRFPPYEKLSYPPWSWVPGINDQAPKGQVTSSHPFPQNLKAEANKDHYDSFKQQDRLYCADPVGPRS